MRVVALLLPDQLADRQHLAPRNGIGGDQLRRPGVVAGAVHDHVLGARDQPRVAGLGLISVGVGVGVDDDAPDADLVAAQLGRDAPPEVLRRHDHRLARRAWKRARPAGAEDAAAAAPGQENRKNHPQQDPERPSAHRPRPHSGCLHAISQRLAQQYCTHDLRNVVVKVRLGISQDLRGDSPPAAQAWNAATSRQRVTTRGDPVGGGGAPGKWMRATGAGGRATPPPP